MAGKILISIHTPVKGVTFNLALNKRPTFTISIHTPVKGVTDVINGQYSGVIYFNPHSREGSDFLLQFAFANNKIFQSTLP